ncbi:DNA binding protein, putative [Ricinus communis]|uniref:DNA binding protein, putative n=2 Tax=Ricinus communis TaxID=3988 RepID=B9T3L8_RICCO|nr:DNA binding protein, putative [Ricinus communis]
MGFDPMTHRPRTDIFSSLPHLIALANLKELIDHRSLEEHAVRLQAEVAQMAKLQHLQYLLQPQTHIQPPAASVATISDNNTIVYSAFSDMETFGLLNSLASIKDIPVPSSTGQLDLSTVTSLPGLVNSDSITFSHLPDLQIPCSSRTPLLNKNKKDSDSTVVQSPPDQFTVFGSSPTSPWIPSTSSTPSPPSNIAPVEMHTCSSSSYGDENEEAPIVWQDLLLDDPLFHQIA